MGWDILGKIIWSFLEKNLPHYPKKLLRISTEELTGHICQVHIPHKICRERTKTTSRPFLPTVHYTNSTLYLTLAQWSAHSSQTPAGTACLVSAPCLPWEWTPPLEETEFRSACPPEVSRHHRYPRTPHGIAPRIPIVYIAIHKIVFSWLNYTEKVSPAKNFKNKNISIW